MNDRIAVRGLRGHGFHGVFGHERRDGQTYVVDAVLTVDTRAAARTDSLADTVDYGGLAERLLSVIEGEPVDLIETLAQRLADVCLIDERVAAVEITVHKPEAPVAAPVDEVAVTIVRTRA